MARARAIARVRRKGLFCQHLISTIIIMYKFVGELGKLGMLHEAILHKCIQQLLAKKKKANIADMSEDIECLCQIMTTVGERLDVPKAEVTFSLIVYI